MSSAPLPEQDLVFVRHGHSCANALKWAGDQRGGLSGAWSKITNHQRGALAADSKLTEIGIRQARAAAAELREWAQTRRTFQMSEDEGAAFDAESDFVTIRRWDAPEAEAPIAIFVSPLRRTLETARELGEALTRGSGRGFRLIPMAGLVEWSQSKKLPKGFRALASGVRSADNIPSDRMPEGFAEHLITSPMNPSAPLQTAYDADGLAKERAGHTAKWQSYTFGGAWEEMLAKARDFGLVLGEGHALVVSHHHRMELYTGVEKRAKASCTTQPRSSFLCVPGAPKAYQKMGNCAIIAVPQGDRDRAEVVWAGEQAPRPQWSDLERCEEGVAETVWKAAGGLDETSATLRELKRQLRAGEARTGVRDVAARRALNGRIARWRARR